MSHFNWPHHIIKSIPIFKSVNILVLSKSGLTARQIASKTGLGKYTVARVIKELLPEKEHVKLGYPSKFSSLDKRRIISSITIGKTDNAVQATSIFAQTACNVLKATYIFKGYGQEKEPSLVS